nr:immunoglobulin light chain junction region [Macaca mulatta]
EYYCWLHYSGSWVF